MRMSREDVIPGYGLDDYDLIEGSTPAMLAELERATGAEEPVIVTLWRPHWAYGAYDIRDLEDPEELLGGAEEIRTLARQDFTADFPEVAEWMQNWTMDDDSMASLVLTVMRDFDAGQEEEAIDAWLSDADNRALVDGWIGK
jgi:glycine betaine/proline transport system substrate-binding protein